MFQKDEEWNAIAKTAVNQRLSLPENYGIGHINDLSTAFSEVNLQIDKLIIQDSIFGTDNKTKETINLKAVRETFVPERFLNFE